MPPTPSHAENSRTMLEQAQWACLSTILNVKPNPKPKAKPAPSDAAVNEAGGYPFGSLVNFAPESNGDVILFTSDLAEHTHNFRDDPRASLQVSEIAGGDPVANGRLTLVGDISLVDDPAEVRDAFLARNPEAAMYVGFRDFHFFRLTVKAVRYVGGFGRMSWVGLDRYRQAQPDPIAPHAAGVIEHMNEDHADAMLVLAQRAGITGAVARMTRVDRYGFDIEVESEDDTSDLRLGFSQTLQSIDELRPEMVRLVREARSE